MIWTPDEDKKLIALYETRQYSMAEIADMLEGEPTPGAVSARISTLGVCNRIIRSDREGYKYCYGCKEDLPIDEFYPRKKTEPDGPRFSRCKSCQKQVKKIAYDKKKAEKSKKK